MRPINTYANFPTPGDPDQIYIDVSTGAAYRWNGSTYIALTTQIAGTGTNDSAAAGMVGEIITSSLAAGSATALTTATPKTITSIALTPGDWDVSGVVDFLPAATTSITVLAEGASAVTNTLGADDTYASDSMAATVPGAVAQRKNIPTQRISIAANTTIYLIASATFTVAAMTGFGTIRARRVR